MMSSARAQIEQLLSKHAKPGYRIDCFEVGTSRRQFAMAEWLRDDEPLHERVSVQGCRDRERAFEELLVGVTMRLRR
jgi:hypothetical protein